MQQSIVEGWRLRYLEVGEGPPLLLVHGFLVSHQEWAACLPELAKHFRCLAVDLIGFGDSDRPDPSRFDYSRRGYARLLNAFLDERRIDSCHLAGHSMGGGIALMMAAQQPQRVQSLSLISPMCFPFPLSLSGRLALVPVIGAAAFRLLYRRAIFRHYFARDVYNGRPLVPLSSIDRYYENFTTDEGRCAAYACLQQSLQFESLVEALPKVSMPTRILWGDEDRVIPMSLAARLQQTLPSATLRTFSQGCHALQEQCSNEVVTELVAHHLAASRPSSARALDRI